MVLSAYYRPCFSSLSHRNCTDLDVDEGVLFHRLLFQEFDDLLPLLLRLVLVALGLLELLDHPGVLFSSYLLLFIDLI